MISTHRLDEVCEVIMGQAPKGENYNTDGNGFPLIAGAGDFGDLYPATKKFTTEASKLSKSGDLVLGIRASIGEKVLSDGIYCLGRGVAGLRVRSDLESRYLWHWLTHISPELSSKAKGATFKQVNRNDIGELKISLPPLPEQRRIADILDRAEALRAKRRATIAKLDTLTQAIFIEMFGDLATSPRGWPVKTIGDLCEVKGGKRLPKGEDYSTSLTPFRYIRVTNLNAGAVDETALVYLKPEVQARIARYIVNAGDVIISIAGSIGLVAPVPPTLDGANLTENAAKLVPRDLNAYDAGFLSVFLQTPYAQNQIKSHVGQVTIGKLALFRIEKIRLPLPPIATQRDFIHRVVAVEKLKTAHRASLSNLDALFSVLQHRAFRGEL